MLATFLIGVGLGSFAGALLSRRLRSVTYRVVLCQLAISATAIVSMYFVNDLPDLYARLFWSVSGGTAGPGYIVAQFIVTAIIVLPATLFMGILFPCVAEMYAGLGERHTERKSASEISPATSRCM